MKFVTRLFVVLFIGVLHANAALIEKNNIQQDSIIRPKRILQTQRVEEAPMIDGKLTDSCWELGEWQSQYTQFIPTYGEQPTNKTEIKILYDDKNIYAAIRAYDDMSEMSRRLDRRDQFSGDLVGLQIDSYFDHRTAYEFDLTSAGQKLDVWVQNDGWDMNWDAVWYGKVAYEDDAWTAEFKIPLSQLRYSPKENQIWGVNSWRLVERKHEESQWNLVANDGTGAVYTFGELHGLEGLKKNKRFEVTPYLSSKLTGADKSSGNPFTSKTNFKGQGGVDAKIGVSNNTTLYATINPDFGQVEADPSVMNLTAFETYFEEKRPFFVEGKSIMDFTFDQDQLFYTRRIGHAPSYNPEYAMMEMPENTTIGGAMKLSGKTSNGLSFGIIESVTTKEEANIYDQGSEFSKAVEPKSNYFIGRFQKEYDKGNTLIGGILTQTHRKIEDDQLNFLPTDALTFGTDFTRYWNDRKYFVEAKLIGSSVKGNEIAIQRLQNSSAHYFQQPDNTSVEYIPNLMQLNGIGASIKTGKWSKGHWRYSEEINYRSPGLELNDLGYMMIANRLKNTSSVSYVETQNKGVFKNFTINSEQQNSWNSGGDKLNSQATISSKIEFMNSWMLMMSSQYNWGINDDHILRGGPSMRLPNHLMNNLMLFTNRAKKLSFSLIGGLDKNTIGSSNSLFVNTGLTLRALSNLQLSFQPTYQRTLNELQYINVVQDGDETNYLLGTIDNRNLGFTFRMDLSISPEMTVQYYGSPFISNGKYSDFKKITTPQSNNYFNRYYVMDPKVIGNTYEFDSNSDGVTDFTIGNPNFNFQQFRNNLVFRWEYRAGSTFYFVWSQDITNFDSSSLSFKEGFRNLFDATPKNIFMVKWNYWFAAN